MSDNKTLAEEVRMFFAYSVPIDVLSDKGRSLIEEIAALEAEVARLREIISNASKALSYDEDYMEWFVVENHEGEDPILALTEALLGDNTEE